MDEKLAQNYSPQYVLMPKDSQGKAQSLIDFSFISWDLLYFPLNPALPNKAIFQLPLSQ